MADKKVEGPSLTGLQPPAPQTTTKKTTKMVFANEEEAKKFLAETEKARADAGKQNKISLKITPQADPNKAPAQKPMTATALRQTAETRGASRSESAKETGLRQGGATATGGVQSKSLPLPPATITKIDKAVLASAAAKMGGVGMEGLEQQIQNPTFQGEVITAARDLFGGGPISRWDIMLLLIAMHYKNRDTHDAIHDASALLKEFKTRADDLQLRVDFVQNNVMAGFKALAAETKAQFGLLSAELEWSQKAGQLVSDLQRHGAESRVMEARDNVGRLEGEVEGYRGPANPPPPTQAEKDAAKTRMQTATARLEAAETNPATTPAELRAARAEFLEARNEYSDMVGSVQAHTDLAAMQPDTETGRARANVERNAARSDETRASAAERNLANARTELEAAEANLRQIYQSFPSESARRGSPAGCALAMTSEANVRLAEMNDGAVRSMDRRLAHMSERRGELQEKLAAGTITPEERAELARLDADIGTLGRRRDRAQAQYQDQLAAVRRMDSEARGVLRDLDELKANGRISDEEYARRISGLQAASTRLAGVVTNPDGWTAAYLRDHPGATPAQAQDAYATEVHAAAVDYQTHIRSAARANEMDRINASERNPDQKREYMVAYDANAAALDRQAVISYDLVATNGRIGRAEGELEVVTATLAGPPAPTGAERTRLEGEATRLRGEIATLNAQKTQLTDDAEQAAIDVELTSGALTAARAQTEGSLLHSARPLASAADLHAANANTSAAVRNNAIECRMRALDRRIVPPEDPNEVVPATGGGDRADAIREKRALRIEQRELRIATYGRLRGTDTAPALAASRALDTAESARRTAYSEATSAYNSIPEPRPSRTPPFTAPPASDTSPRANAIRTWIAAEGRLTEATRARDAAQTTFDNTAAPLTRAAPGEVDVFIRPAAPAMRNIERERISSSGRSPEQITEYMRAYDANADAESRAAAMRTQIGSLDRRLAAERAELSAVTAALAGPPPPTGPQREALLARQASLRQSIRADEAQKQRLQAESARADRDVTTTRDALMVARREYPNASGPAKFTSAESMRRLNDGVSRVLTASDEMARADAAAAETGVTASGEITELLGPNPGLLTGEVNVPQMEVDRTRFRDLMTVRDGLISERAELERQRATISATTSGAERDRRLAEIDRNIAHVNQRIMAMTPEIADIGARTGFTPGLSEADKTTRAGLMTERATLINQTPLPTDRIAEIDRRIGVIDGRVAPALQTSLSRRDDLIKQRTVGPFSGGDRNATISEVAESLRGLDLPDTRIDATLRSGLGTLMADRARLQSQRDAIAAGNSPTKAADLARLDGEISAVNARIADARQRVGTLRASARTPDATLTSRAATARANYATAVDSLGTIRRDVDLDSVPSTAPGSGGSRTYGAPPVTRTFPNEAAELAAYDGARRDILREYYTYSGAPISGGSVTPFGTEPPYVPRAVSTAYEAIPDNPRPSRPPPTPIPADPAPGTPNAAQITAWYAAERELAAAEAANPRVQATIDAARTRAETAHRAIPDAPRPPGPPAALPTRPPDTDTSPRAVAVRNWLDALSANADHHAAFARDYGAWESRPPVAPATESTFRMTGTPSNAPPSPLPAAWPTTVTPPLTIDEVNDPSAITDPARRSAAMDFRTEVATARMQILNEDTTSRVTDIGHRANDHWPAAISQRYDAAVARRDAALAGLGGAPPGPTEPESTTDPARRQLVEAYMAANRETEDITLEGNAASYTPPRDPTAAKAALATVRTREAEARTATAAADAFDNAHPAPRSTADQAESERLRGLATTATQRVTEARTAFDEAARDIRQPYNARGNPTNPDPARLNTNRPDNPGKTFWEWTKVVLGFAAPAAMAADTAANFYLQGGAAVHRAYQASQEIKDEYFDRAHAELKQVKRKTQVDWMQKMSVIKALVDAHVKAGGTPGG